MAANGACRHREVTICEPLEGSRSEWSALNCAEWALFRI